MTTHSRIAAFLSTSALCLSRGGAGGLRRGRDRQAGRNQESDGTHGQTPQGRQDLGRRQPPPAAAKSDKMDKTDKAGAMTPATTPAK